MSRTGRCKKKKPVASAMCHRKNKNQVGGMLPGLIAAIITAKRRKKSVGSAAKKYLSGAVGRWMKVK